MNTNNNHFQMNPFIDLGQKIGHHMDLALVSENKADADRHLSELQTLLDEAFTPGGDNFIFPYRKRVWKNEEKNQRVGELWEVIRLTRATHHPAVFGRPYCLVGEILENANRDLKIRQENDLENNVYLSSGILAPLTAPFFLINIATLEAIKRMMLEKCTLFGLTENKLYDVSAA